MVVASTSADSRARLREFANEKRSFFEDALCELIEIPSISKDPDHLVDIRRCGEAAARLIREAGGEAELIETAGNPIVHGRFDHGPGEPTITVYNHLDVQPANEDDEHWERPPFRFVREGDRYFGRGTTDDKGPAVTALLGILAARELGVKANLRLLWELEEETGSESFLPFVKKDPGRFASDVFVISDTEWISRDRPSIITGLRGWLGLTFRLETATLEAHSGGAGGAARNPLSELIAVMARIQDGFTGEVFVPGFYDDVVDPTPDELEGFERSGFDVDHFMRSLGLLSVRTSERTEFMKRIWTRPCFEIHAVDGGYRGPGIKSVIPARAEVKASCRLAPGQDPDTIFERISEFARGLCADVVVEKESTAPAYLGATDGREVDAVRNALMFGFGEEPAFVRTGGTIGPALTLHQVFDAPVVFLGLSLPEHGYHAANENFDWGQASGGIAAFARFFELMAQCV